MTTIPAAPKSPMAPPGAGAVTGTPPGAKAPPFGSSPATGPTQNRGYEAQALQELAVAVDQLGALMPKLGAASEAGQAVNDAIRKLAKFVPPGSVTPAAKANVMQTAATKNAQMGPQVQQMRQMAAQGPQPPGAAPAA